MYKLLIAFIVFVAAAVSCAAQEESFYCTHFGGMAEKVCPVSMITLTLNHKPFLHKSVAVTGYVGKIDNSYYLFTTSEFYRDRSMANSVFLKGQENLFSQSLGKKITVIGKVSLIENSDDNLFRPFAKIDVQMIQ